MYKALVCCKAGMGTSMLLKIKVDQVIEENKFPIEVAYGSFDTLNDFKGDLVITLEDLSLQIKDKAPYVIGVKDILDKEEILEKLNQFLKNK